MNIIKKNNFKLFLFFLIILVLFFYLFQKSFLKEKTLILKPITINLLTSVHSSLPWDFKPTKPRITVIPGEVTTVEYIVENLGGQESTGIATFDYYPNQLGNYISKINCFCYDAQTLKPKQKGKYTLVLLIDPEATKDDKTKNVKEVTIQFTFFDYKEYKKQES